MAGSHALAEPRETGEVFGSWPTRKVVAQCAGGFISVAVNEAMSSTVPMLERDPKFHRTVPRA